MLFTLGLLAVYRLGNHAPTPGINAQSLIDFFEQNRGNWFGLVDMFSGGNLAKVTIFALGIMPLSGEHFGLYLTSYVWLYAAVRFASTVVRAENTMVLVFIIIAAVASQNGIFFMVLGMSGAGGHGTGEMIRVVSEQIGWVLLIGPLIALGMRQAKRLTSRRTRKVAESPSAAGIER